MTGNFEKNYLYQYAVVFDLTCMCFTPCYSTVANHDCFVEHFCQLQIWYLAISMLSTLTTTLLSHWPCYMCTNARLACKLHRAEVSSCCTGPVLSYNLRFIVGFWLFEIAISTNQKPTIYRNLYDLWVYTRRSTCEAFPWHGRAYSYVVGSIRGFRKQTGI